MFVTPITGPTVSFYHTSEERIQKAIQEKDYGRALDLMILLCNQEEVEDPLLLFLYEHAFLILSELSPDQFTRFQSLFLPNLLRNSPHLVEKQHDLAQALGNFFFNQEKATPSSYKISLHYWVLANHLSTKGNLHSCLDLTPIFTSFIEKRLINEEPFRKTCAYLTASGNLDGLTKTWHKGKELTPFFPKLLFQILHEQGEKGHAERLTNSCQKTFAPIAKEIIMGFFENQQKEDLNSTLAQRWRSFLEKYRAAFEEDDSDLKTYQHNLTKAFKERFFVPLIEDALFFLGLPPCGFDIRAMGSLARNELSKTSDLEYFILIEKEEHLPYFKTLASFLELQFIALGETKLPQDFPTFSALGDFSGGIHIDIGGNPLVNDSIATPRTLAQSFFSGGEEAYEPNSLSHTLMRSTSLYSQGKDLFSPFNEEITKRLDENINGKSRRVNRYKAHKQKRILDFESSHRFTNFKTQYIEPLFHLLSDLGILYRIQEANTLDIIDALHGKKVFSQQGTSFLKQSVSLLYHMRLGKTPKDENLLSQIEQRAIKPLYGFIKKDLDLAQLSPGNKTYQPKPSYSQEPTAPTPYLRTPPQPMNPERKFIQLPQNKLVEVKQKDLSKNNQEKIDSIRSRLMDEIERSFLTAQDSKAFEDKENLEAKIKELKTTLLSDRDPFREVINRYDQRYLKLLPKPKETPTPTILPLYIPSDYYTPDPQNRPSATSKLHLNKPVKIPTREEGFLNQFQWLTEQAKSASSGELSKEERKQAAQGLIEKIEKKLTLEENEKKLIRSVIEELREATTIVNARTHYYQVITQIGKYANQVSGANNSYSQAQPHPATPPQPVTPERKFIQLPRAQTTQDARKSKLVEVKQEEISKNNQEKVDSIRGRLMDEIERSFLTAQDSKTFEDKENLGTKIKELKTTLLSDRDPFREVINRYDQRYLKLLQKPKETPTPTILPLYVPSDYYIPDPQERAREKAEVNLGYAREIERVKNYYSSQGIWTDHDYNIAGMHLYWKKRHRKAGEKIADLDTQIANLDAQISDLSAHGENKIQLINNRTLLREQRHTLKERELLDSKIYAAYFLYLGGNKTDTREVHEFLKFQPMSIQKVDDHREANRIRINNHQNKVKKAPRYSSISGEITLSRKEVRESDIHTLSQKIFTAQNYRAFHKTYKSANQASGPSNPYSQIQPYSTAALQKIEKPLLPKQKYPEQSYLDQMQWLLRQVEATNTSHITLTDARKKELAENLQTKISNQETLTREEQSFVKDVLNQLKIETITLMNAQQHYCLMLGKISKYENQKSGPNNSYSQTQPYSTATPQKIEKPPAPEQKEPGQTIRLLQQVRTVKTHNTPLLTGTRKREIDFKSDNSKALARKILNKRKANSENPNLHFDLDPGEQTLFQAVEEKAQQHFTNKKYQLDLIEFILEEIRDGKY